MTRTPRRTQCCPWRFRSAIGSLTTNSSGRSEGPTTRGARNRTGHDLASAYPGPDPADRSGAIALLSRKLCAHHCARDFHWIPLCSTRAGNTHLLFPSTGLRPLTPPICQRSSRYGRSTTISAVLFSDYRRQEVSFGALRPPRTLVGADRAKLLQRLFPDVAANELESFTARVAEHRSGNRVLVASGPRVRWCCARPARMQHGWRVTLGTATGTHSPLASSWRGLTC